LALIALLAIHLAVLLKYEHFLAMQEKILKSEAE